MTNKLQTAAGRAGYLVLSALAVVACSGGDPDGHDLDDGGSGGEPEIGSVAEALKAPYWVTGIYGQCEPGDHTTYTNCYANVGTADYGQCYGTTASNYRQCEENTEQFDTCDVFCPSGYTLVSSRPSPLCNGDYCCRAGGTQSTCKKTVCGNGVRETGAFGFGEQCDDGSRNTDVRMTCAPGQASCSNCSTGCQLQAGNPLPLPTLTLTLDASTIAYGTGTTLRWVAQNVSSCTRSGAVVPLSGSAATGSLYQSTSYAISCSGTYGSVTASKTVAVAAELHPPTLSLTLDANSIPYQGTTTLRWTSQYADKCTLGTRTLPTSGAWVTPALVTTTSYSVTCTGHDGSVTRNQQVTVAAPAANTPSGSSCTWQVFNGNYYPGGRVEVSRPVTPCLHSIREEYYAGNQLQRTEYRY